MTATMKQIGKIGVKAGLCWIGDPCNVLHTPPPKAIGKKWGEFRNIIESATTKQFDYDIGHPGLGVVVSTGHGDGVYPVYAEFDQQGHVTKVSVEFIEENTVKQAPEIERNGQPLNFYDSLAPSDN